MSSPDQEALVAPQPEIAALPDERDRELLDYLIECACNEMLRSMNPAPKNDNQSKTHATRRVP